MLKVIEQVFSCRLLNIQSGKNALKFGMSYWAVICHSVFSYIRQEGFFNGRVLKEKIYDHGNPVSPKKKHPPQDWILDLFPIQNKVDGHPDQHCSHTAYSGKYGQHFKVRDEFPTGVYFVIDKHESECGQQNIANNRFFHINPIFTISRIFGNGHRPRGKITPTCRSWSLPCHPLAYFHPKICSWNQCHIST
jgi:hypothetical protein